MIQGVVNALKQAVISLQLHGPAGQIETVDAVIDTGFDGFLAVSPALAARLQFPFREIRSYEIGDGSTVDFDIHEALVTWDGQLRHQETLVTAGGILIGMSMLSGYTLFIDTIDGGEVRIALRP